jgi:hypothetical protein
MTLDFYQTFSILIALFGAMFLYFGKIIQDIQVDEGDKFQIYYNGFIFSLVHVLLPFGIAYFVIFSQTTFNEGVGSFLLYIPMLIVIVLIIYVRRYHRMRRQGLSIMRNRDDVKMVYGLPVLGISFLNWLITFYYYGIYQQNQTGLNFVNMFMSVIITIFTLSVLAGIFGYHSVWYPTVTINTDTEIFSDVKLIKSGKTVQISRAGRLVIINKDKIKNIEILD